MAILIKNQLNDKFEFSTLEFANEIFSHISAEEIKKAQAKQEHNSNSTRQLYENLRRLK